MTGFEMRRATYFALGAVTVDPQRRLVLALPAKRREALAHGNMPVGDGRRSFQPECPEVENPV
jgi:hypothetical protein